MGKAAGNEFVAIRETSAGTTIAYTNPKRLASGKWKCVACGVNYPDEGAARRCAEDDHGGKEAEITSPRVGPLFGG